MLQTTRSNQLENTLLLQPKPRVLIVEDDVTMEPLWTYIIDQVAPGAYLKWVTSEEAAEHAIRYQLLRHRPYDLVISDVFLSSSRTGIDLWRQFNESDTAFLFMSVISPNKFAKLIGPNEPTPTYLQKPLNPDECSAAVKALLE